MRGASVSVVIDELTTIPPQAARGRDSSAKTAAISVPLVG